jgi:hypothetical protein
MEVICFFSSDDLAEVENVKAMLEDNDIPVMVKNAYTQNLFGGLKPFSGHDPIAGSIQIFINESEYDKASKIIEESGLFQEGIDSESIENEADKTIEDIKQKENEDDEFMKSAKEKRDIYFASSLTAMSFLILPYLVNLFLLYKIGKKRKTISIMLLCVSTLFCGVSVFAYINTR